MTEQSLWFLENIDVKAIFCPTKLGAGAMEQHTHITYKRGEYIYLPEQSADKIYFISEGRIRIGQGQGEREITKAILGVGEVFGELSIVGEQKRQDFAYAMEHTVVCVLTVHDMCELMRSYEGLSLFIMKIISGRVIEMEQRLTSLVFKDSRTRVVEFLHDLALHKGQRVGYERVVRKFITHQEIANLTATSRQTVTTILNELRAKNIITFDRKRLLVRDMDLLAAEA